MPDPSTSMMSSSSGDAGVTPFVVPDDLQKQSTMAKFLHGMAMTHLGLAGMEFQQQQQQKQQTAQMYSQALQSQPNLAGDEHFMKGFAEVTSPNLANAMGMWAHSADIQRKLAQKQLQGAFGDQTPQAPPTSSGTPSELPATTISQGPTAAPESRLDYLRRVLPQREAIERHPAFAALPEAQQKAVSSQLRQMEEEMRALEAKETPAAETPAQKEHLDIERQHLSLDKQRENREEKSAANLEQDRQFKRDLSQQKLDWQKGIKGGAKGITAEKLAQQRQQFMQKFAAKASGDPDQAVALNDAWTDYLNHLKESGTDPKVVEQFYTGGATEESAGGISGALGSKKAVLNPTAPTHTASKSGKPIAMGPDGKYHYVSE